MFVGSVCIFISYGSRGLPASQGQPGSLGSSFSSLPGDAAELKECVNTAQFVI